MEEYLIPWIITIIKMVIVALLLCVVGALLEKYLPNHIKEKIVEMGMREVSYMWSPPAFGRGGYTPMGCLGKMISRNYIYCLITVVKFYCKPIIYTMNWVVNKNKNKLKLK